MSTRSSWWPGRPESRPTSSTFSSTPLTSTPALKQIRVSRYSCTVLLAISQRRLSRLVLIIGKPPTEYDANEIWLLRTESVPVGCCSEQETLWRSSVNCSRLDLPTSCSSRWLSWGGRRSTCIQAKLSSATGYSSRNGIYWASKSCTVDIDDYEIVHTCTAVYIFNSHMKNFLCYRYHLHYFYCFA